MQQSLEICYSGQRYEAVVPDTLDLADRAELSINGLGGTTDPKTQYQMYFLVHFACQPPYMAHHCDDTTCTPKYAESFPMMRLMCGSDRYLELEEAQRQALLAMMQDGLYWNLRDPGRPWRLPFNKPFDGELKDEDVANVLGNGRMLRALATWYELDQKPAWEARIRDLIGGLNRIAIHRDDYSYYPDGGFGEPFNYPRSGWLRTNEPQSETEGGEGSVVCYHGHQIQGLARWFALSGDKEALELARRLANFTMLPKFWGGLPDPDGEREGLAEHVAPRLPDPVCVSGEEQGHWYSHFHGRAIGLRGMLEYGMVAGDVRVLEFVRRAYEYTWVFGIPRMGWVNCFPAALNLCEGCALGDLVAMGIRLSDAGLGDYWDTVDAIVRNHLVEQQLTRPELLEAVAAASPLRKPEERSQYPYQEVEENVIARSLGNFAGTSSPTSIPNTWVMQCCTGNATQGLYYAWEGALRQSGDTAQVNLLLNRAARLLDVDSYLPHCGKVVIRNKGATRVSVRIPSWVPRRQIRAEVSSATVPLAWVGNYLVFDNLRPGDNLIITFPLTETTARYTVNASTPMEQTYTYALRGSTLVDISPRDTAPTSYPLYLREHLRRPDPPTKTVQRFVTDNTIVQW